MAPRVFAPTGLIHLVDQNGGLVATAHYSMPLIVRDRQLTVSQFLYEQQGQDKDGVHVYRQVGPQKGEDSIGIEQVIAATPTSPLPGTWEDVGRWFAQYRNTTEPVPISRIRDLESLVQSALDTDRKATVVIEEAIPNE